MELEYSPDQFVLVREVIDRMNNFPAPKNNSVAYAAHLYNSVIKLQQRLATVDVERDRLLEVVKLFYRKHVLNDESIGWDELGDKLYNELSEILGDKEFCKWLDTQSM